MQQHVLFCNRNGMYVAINYRYSMVDWLPIQSLGHLLLAIDHALLGGTSFGVIGHL